MIATRSIPLDKRDANSWKRHRYVDVLYLQLFVRDPNRSHQRTKGLRGMSMSPNKTALLLSAAVILSIGIFTLDVLTPLGAAIWALYALPIVLAYWLARPRMIFLITLLATILILLGFFLSPPGATPLLGLLNRCLGSGFIWFATAVLMRQQQADKLSSRLAAIVNFSDDAIIGKNLDGIITTWNRGAEKLFGYTATEIVGTSIMRLIPADRQQEEEQILGRIKLGESVNHFHTQRQTKDGRLLDISVTVSPIRDHAGTIIGASKIARDVTQQKQNEQELARLNRLYVALSHVNQAIVWTPVREELFPKICQVLVEHGGFHMAWIGWHDPETRQIVPVAVCGDPNGYMQSTKIYSDDRPEGRGPTGLAFRGGHFYICNDLLNDPVTVPWRPELQRRGLRASAVFPIRQKNEVRGTLTVYSDEPFFFQDKEIRLLEEAATDVSFALDNFAKEEARRLAERTLWGEKHFSDTMIESMPGVVYFYDANGKFLRWNQNFEAVTGYSGEEIARMHPRDFFSEEERPRVEQRTAEAFTQGASSVEAPFVGKDGRSTLFFFTGRRVLFGEQMCLIGVGIDVSDRRRAEDRLAESERKYRELVENANSIILRWNVGGRITFLNEFGQRFFGYSAEEIVGQKITGTILPTADSGGRVLNDLLDEICRNPEAFEQNISENVRRNGERVWVAWTNRIVRDSQGRVVEFLSIGSDITERRNAETALREAEVRFHTLFEQTPVGVVVVDPVTTSMIECNEQAARQLGYTPQEFCRLSLFNIDVHETKEDTQRRVERILRDGRDQFETKHRSKTGEYRDVFVTGRLVELAGRKVIYCVFLDITENKLAEAALQQSLERFTAVARATNDAVWDWNLQSNFIWWNKNFQTLFGFQAEEVEPRIEFWASRLHENDKERVLAGIHAVIDGGGRMWSDEYRFRRRDGSYAEILDRGHVLRDETGRGVRMVGTLQDITERKQAEAKLRESEARYRTLFEYAPDGIVIANSESYYVDANASICRMLGYKREELVGLHATDIVAEAEIRQIEPALAAINGKADHHREWQFRRKNGSFFPAEVIATMMPDGNLLGMIRDITERKEAESEREKRHQAEAADRIKSAFLATMSHELRTPLNSIIGFTGIIIQGLAGPLNEEQSKQLNMVRTSARHLLALVNDVLDISKIEAGQLEVANVRFDLKRSIAKVVALVAPMAEKKGLKLRVQIAPQLGECVSDERRFEQILLNLLSNAIKFSDRGEIALTADQLDRCPLPGVPSGQSAVRLRVSDTGIGIKPNDLLNLFQPFRQIDSGLSRNHDGTGLGLAICRRLADLMGGEIIAESEWGKGSTFSVTLPLQGSVKS